MSTTPPNGSNGNGRDEADSIATIEQRLLEQYREDPDRAFKLAARAAAISEHLANRMLVSEETHRAPCATVLELRREVARIDGEVQELKAASE